MANAENYLVDRRSNTRNPDQPEDNASVVPDGSSKADATAPRSASTAVQHAEPEDAYLTGGQRNLQRRVLGLNVEGGQAQKPAEQSPGVHSTGSHTGTANAEGK